MFSVILLISLVSPTWGFSMTGSSIVWAASRSQSKHSSSSGGDFEDALNSQDNSLWNERVVRHYIRLNLFSLLSHIPPHPQEYVDLNAKYEDDPDSKRRELPLFLLGGAFYPQGLTYLNVFGME